MIYKKHTIKDIAKLAGVSKGTVERVLHNRGKVSKVALDKINHILKEINYQPNPIAQNLKSNKVYSICVLMPDPDVDSFWIPAVNGINEAAKKFSPFGVIVSLFFYDPFDSVSFLEKGNQIINSTPDALLMAPLLQKEGFEVYEKCKKGNILVAFFNNYIDTLKEEIFIGQDLQQSGRVAASLIDKVIPSNSQIGIIHMNMETHMEIKEKGFIDFFSKRAKTPTIIVKHFSSVNLKHFNIDLENFLNEHPTTSALFITNSKAHLVANYLIETRKELVVVGYDLLNQNIDFLKKGVIDFLIHQKPKSQAFLSIEYLAEHLLFRKELPIKKLLPIDIITSENV